MSEPETARIITFQKRLQKKTFAGSEFEYMRIYPIQPTQKKHTCVHVCSNTILKRKKVDQTCFTSILFSMARFATAHLYAEAVQVHGVVEDRTGASATEGS